MATPPPLSSQQFTCGPRPPPGWLGVSRTHSLGECSPQPCSPAGPGTDKKSQARRRDTSPSKEAAADTKVYLAGRFRKNSQQVWPKGKRQSLHLGTGECTSFSIPSRTFIELDHALGGKTSLNNHIRLRPRAFYNHSAVKTTKRHISTCHTIGNFKICF